MRAHDLKGFGPVGTNAASRVDRNVFDYHAEAIAARWLWGAEYSRQSGGQMDFYDSLDDARKQLCRELVDEIKDTEKRA